MEEEALMNCLRQAGAQAATAVQRATDSVQSVSKSAEGTTLPGVASMSVVFKACRV